jgi:hypothetical protein
MEPMHDAMADEHTGLEQRLRDLVSARRVVGRQLRPFVDLGSYPDRTMNVAVGVGVLATSAGRGAIRVHDEMAEERAQPIATYLHDRSSCPAQL